MSETATISRVYVENPYGDVEGCGVIYLEDLERHRVKVGSGIPLPVSLEYHVGARQQEFVKSYGSCGVPWKYSSVSIRDYVQSIGTEFYLIEDDPDKLDVGTWGGVLVKCDNLKKLGLLTEETLRHIYTVTAKRSTSQTPQRYLEPVYLNLVGMNESDRYSSTILAELKDRDGVVRDGRFEVGGTKYGGKAQWLDMSDVEEASGGVVWNEKWNFVVDVDAATLEVGKSYTICAVGFYQQALGHGYISGVRCSVSDEDGRKRVSVQFGCWTKRAETGFGFYIDEGDKVVRFILGHDNSYNLTMNVYKDNDPLAACSSSLDGIGFSNSIVEFFRIGALGDKVKIQDSRSQFVLEEDSQVGRFDVLEAFFFYRADVDIQKMYTMKWLASSTNAVSTDGDRYGGMTNVVWDFGSEVNGGSGLDCSGYDVIGMFFTVEPLVNNTDFIYRFLSRKEGGRYERGGTNTQLFGSYGFEMFLKNPFDNTTDDVSAFRQPYLDMVSDDRFKNMEILEEAFRLDEPFKDIFYEGESETTADWYKYIKIHDEWGRDFSHDGKNPAYQHPAIACRLATSKVTIGEEVEDMSLLPASGWAVNEGPNHRWTNKSSTSNKCFYPFFVFNYDPALVNRFLGYAQMKGVPTTLAMEKQSPTGYVPCLTREQMILLSELLLPTFDWATGNFDTLEDGKQYFVKFPYDDYLGFLEMVEEIQ